MRMNIWIMGGSLAVIVLAAAVLFFFLATRGALLLRGLSPDPHGDRSHVYPLYSNMRLIRFIDYQPIISLILLFQYHRIVSTIVSGLDQSNLQNKKVLITSCAFGNVIPRVVKAAVQGGAERIIIADIIDNELVHAKHKLASLSGKVDFIEEDAAAMKHEDGIVDANVMFFLLHELPHNMKTKALNEAGRMLAPGGKLFLAEFHRPESWILRVLGWTYFKVFEPLGLALWDTHDPMACLENIGGWLCERTTYFFGNFQIIVATKL